MLSVATSLGRSGFQDWIIQRVTAVILALYSLFLIVFCVLQPEITYFSWQNLYSLASMQLFTLVALLSLLAHAWIGLWTITTDYLKVTWLRLTTQVIIYICLLFYFIWGIQILWG